jgi:hypothetical protein
MPWTDPRLWGLTGRRRSDFHAEGDAGVLLDAVGMRRSRAIDLVVVTKRARIDLDPRATPGCLASFDPTLGVIRFRLRGSLSTAYRTLAHELGHCVLCATVGREHGEGDATRTAIAMWMPRGAVERAVKDVGLNPVALALRFPYVPMQLMMLRVAWVIDRPIILHLGRERLVWAPAEFVIPPEGTWERERQLIARVQGGYRDLLGADAWQVEDAGRRGTLLVLPPRDDAETWRRIDDWKSRTG